MIAFEARPSWLGHRGPGRTVMGKRTVSRNGISVALLGSVVAILIAAGDPPPAFAAPAPVDQARWWAASR